MTIDEKLEEFSNSAIDAATKQSQEQINEYKDSLKKLFEEHKNDAQNKANSTLRLESDNFMREKNRRLSTDAITMKRQLNEKQDELKDTLFSHVTEKLVSFMKTEDYTKILVKRILEAKIFSKGEPITIYINESDADKKSFLETETGLKLTISKIDFFGGIRAVIPSKSVLIDYSFLTKLAEEKETFTLL